VNQNKTVAELAVSMSAVSRRLAGDSVVAAVD
jgi:hypothetical protein